MQTDLQFYAPFVWGEHNAYTASSVSPLSYNAPDIVAARSKQNNFMSASAQAALQAAQAISNSAGAALVAGAGAALQPANGGTEIQRLGPRADSALSELNARQTTAGGF
ncbi:hypothetical protein EVAR_44058_1 [Eumeta japonica]|uniref:Uncharacterized protein n=1 Tax=Eumeta variegata TaxID=151549 RepID=A0A4C1X2P4_EUMVA|nr:hypothetical protein EVAR_44058_1 [Eumeta japonica]